MTLEQIQALTDDEIRVRVAELCGWQWEKLWTGELHGKPIGEQGPFREVPNYPADLNACHEFEHGLSYDQASEYGQALLKIRAAERWDDRPPAGDHAFFHTPRARCEAFLATMGEDTL